MKRYAAISLVALTSACGPLHSQWGTMPQSANASLQHRASLPITHVVVIMQENRSFDNFFRGFPGADSATFGYGHGVKYPLTPKHLTWTFDLNHYRWQFLEDYDGGKNDGWNDLINGSTSGCPYGKGWVNHPSCWNFLTGKSYQKMAFSYVYKAEIQPYWTMASEYTLGDHNFGSTNGPSFGEHQMLIAGQDGHADEVPELKPWGCDTPKKLSVNWEYYLHYGQANPPEFPPAFGHDVVGYRPCFTYATVAGLLDGKHISWRWYKQPDPPAIDEEGRDRPDYNQYDSFWLDAFDAIKPIRYGPDYKNVVTPDTRVLTDIANASLAQVSWVMPHGGASDHPGSGSGNCGPAWITAIVNAIGKSSYWDSTAIIITWDEWGGWFDHVVPPLESDPVTGAYEGLGYRTPLIIISPYAKTHYVSKAVHETASSLRFIENVFGLGQLPPGNLADARADGYDDVFVSQSPTKFKPIPEPSNYQYCLSQRNAPPDRDY